MGEGEEGGYGLYFGWLGGGGGVGYRGLSQEIASFLFEKFYSFLIKKLLPNHNYYRPLKNRPNYHYRSHKIEKSREKKVFKIFRIN